MRTRAAAVALVVGLVVAACGDVDPESLAFAEDEQRPGRTMLRFATYTEHGFADALEAWEREHPTVEVVLDVQPLDEHHDRLIAVADDVSGPDVLVIESSFLPTIEEPAALFLDLGDPGTSSRFAIPVAVDGMALAYRSDLYGGETLSADSWCELVLAGEEYTARTGRPFLAEAADLFEAVVAQEPLQFYASDGTTIHATNPRIRRAWDLAMRTLGAEPADDDPCPAARSTHAMGAAFTAGSAEWKQGLRDGEFAAVLAPSSMLEQIRDTAPETAGSWSVVAVPGVTAGPGGAHLAVGVDTELEALARDLVATLAAPTTQRGVYFSSGRFPADATAQGDPAVLAHTSPFYGDSPLGELYAASVAAEIDAPTGPDSPLILREFRAGIARVASGALDPEAAWNEVLWRVERFQA